jgi:hypothetical protein
MNVVIDSAGSMIAIASRVYLLACNFGDCVHVVECVDGGARCGSRHQPQPLLDLVFGTGASRNRLSAAWETESPTKR